MFINRRAFGEGRKFGKDLTNCPVQEQRQKKHSFKDIKPTTLQDYQLSKPKDAIDDYVQQIHSFLHRTDNSMQEEIPYQSTDVTEKMREILIDWLVDVHLSFGLKEETLQLAIMYLEEYQAQRYIEKDNYQLVGITCLWIASKYEEIYPPNLKKFVEVTAYTYNADNIKKMEGDILLTLKFDLSKVTPLTILRTEEHQFPHPKGFNLAKYIIQLTFLNKRVTSKHQVRVIVAAAVKIVRGIYSYFSVSEQLFLGLNETEVHSVYKELCLMLKLQNKYKLTALKRKFSSEQYSGVGKITLEM